MINSDYNISNLTNNELEKKVNENGRIDLLSHNGLNNGTPLFLQDQNLINERTNYNNCRTHLFEKSDLEKIFFSMKNIEEIQNQIIIGVYDRSNGEYRIDNQDYDALNIIMRSIFLQYSLNQQSELKEQVLALNKLVVNYCVPKIYSEVIGFMKYKRDVSRISVPPNLPKSTNYNNTTLELNRFF
ncbi:hypothetical protein CL656_07240 [bacterium]|nr:hypothetical protein [bacterium]|tara:strand:- start:6 stop:560 length:555 start_codon:yes stop_codon:yes gene_type:complete